MSIFWYEQSAIDVPDTNAWLSERERSYLTSLRFSKRIDDWRLGRWTGKRSVAAWLALPSAVSSLSEIEILPSQSGAPLVFIARDRVPIEISLSHRSGKAVCTLGPCAARIGCDLELVESRDATFVSDYLATGEQAILKGMSEGRRALIITLLWSVKESALKALHWGLRLDTKCLEVHFPDAVAPITDKDWSATYPIVSPNRDRPAGTKSSDIWHPVQASLRGAPAFIGWWRNADQFVRTVLIRRASSFPSM